ARDSRKNIGVTNVPPANPRGNVIGVGQLSLLDLNDAIVSGSPPLNPSNGSLWIDESQTPAMLNKWNGVRWVEMGQLDPELSVTIEEINSTLGNMANDSLIDFKERQVIKDKLTEILGYVIDDSATYLPASSTLYSSGRGELWAVRNSALSAGIEPNNATYVNVATRYDNLKSYLDMMYPTKVWDARTVNSELVIEVDKATFRDM